MLQQSRQTPSPATQSAGIRWRRPPLDADQRHQQRRHAAVIPGRQRPSPSTSPPSEQTERKNPCDRPPSTDSTMTITIAQSTQRHAACSVHSRLQTEIAARSSGGRLQDTWPACARPPRPADRARAPACSSGLIQDNRARTVCRMKAARRRASTLRPPRSARSPASEPHRQG